MAINFGARLIFQLGWRKRKSAQTCIVLKRLAVCNARRHPSKCPFGGYPVYYYDPKKNSCERTTDCTYVGNNFPTLNDCQATCMRERPSGPNADPCSVLPSEGHYCKSSYGSFRFLYDSDGKTCQLFWYRGCGGTQNNFRSYYTCLKRCAGKYLDENAGKF
ncbi:hypothetical protein HPB50_016127 [Hyalomma asiaticum]|uniref:Uncharacterized protein n=1 Tax=Hyalomma asiaticum TaxID=266040 RepID=A0ACB7RSG2_HYAAI|nr:hypothetical protein HPB50_016127 [Hyalomma asiaticum]